MTEKNGRGNELNLAPHKVIDIPMSSGVTARVTPLNRMVIAGITRKAAELFPAPDPKDYEQDLPPGVALDENLKLPAEKNPDYRAAQFAVTVQRDVYIMTAIFEIAVEWLDAKGVVIPQPALISHFAHAVTTMRQYSDVLPTDEWQATLYACIAPDTGERRQVIDAAMDAAPLERGEVLAEIAQFRIKVPGQAVAELDTASRSIPEQVSGAE